MSVVWQLFYTDGRIWFETVVDAQRGAAEDKRCLRYMVPCSGTVPGPLGGVQFDCRVVVRVS